jgi:hypothetical protein
MTDKTLYQQFRELEDVRMRLIRRRLLPFFTAAAQWIISRHTSGTDNRASTAIESEATDQATEAQETDHRNPSP